MIKKSFFFFTALSESSILFAWWWCVVSLSWSSSIRLFFAAVGGTRPTSAELHGRDCGHTKWFSARKRWRCWHVWGYKTWIIARRWLSEKRCSLTLGRSWVAIVLKRSRNKSVQPRLQIKTPLLQFLQHFLPDSHLQILLTWIFIQLCCGKGWMSELKTSSWFPYSRNVTTTVAPFSATASITAGYNCQTKIHHICMHVVCNIQPLQINWNMYYFLPLPLL